MAITAAERKEMVQVVVGMFDAAPGYIYLNDFIGFAGQPAALIAALAETEPFKVMYPVFLTNAEFVARFVDSIIDGANVPAAARTWAVDSLVSSLNAGASRADVMAEALTALLAVQPSNTDWAEAKQQFDNKVTVAEYYSVEMRGQATDVAQLQAVIANVTADSDMSDIEELINPTPVEPIGLSFSLTVGQDDITGDAGANAINAPVVQNASGAQVNTLGSGDSIDGGAATDTLNAKITNGVFAGGSYSMPIQPETKSVEIVKLEAALSDVPGPEYEFDNYYNESPVDQVFVNAKDMTDVEQLWSNRSDADLTIMNLTTKGLDQLSDMTIGMAYTGNKDTNWGASDYHVYFDQDYLVPDVNRTDESVFVEVMNEDGYDVNEEQPLAGVFFRQFTLTLNGEEFDLAAFLGEDPEGAGTEITTYAGLLTAVNAAIEQLKAANLDNAALQTLTASLNGNFFADRNPDTQELRVGQALVLTVEGQTDGVANELRIEQTDLELARAAKATVANNNRYERAENDPAQPVANLGINVALEKVGLAGDGGELVIGSMNKAAYNSWNEVNTVVDGTTSGIEEFYVTVYGDASKSSSLAGLHSTNNNLRVVTVKTDEAVDGSKGYANLTIGNSNTQGYALKDVQTFDASAFKGDLSLQAALTSEVTAKYFDLQDEAPAAPAADNQSFDYIGGTGNDSFDIKVDPANWQAAGSVTREDLMKLTVNGGAGDDDITVNIASAAEVEGVVPNWYDNQKLLKNVTLLGGEGNDTISKPGSGDVTIDGGAGNDTVYAENTGGKATWVFNAVAGEEQTSDIESSANDKYNLFKSSVVVNFKGIEVKAAIVDKQGVATDLDINQAIKKAVNSDPVLSKLLSAEDGPANTLVIESLIDGSMVGELVVTIAGPKAADLSAGDLTSLNGWYPDTVPPFGTADDAVTYLDGQAAIFNNNAGGEYNQVLWSDGYQSFAVSDNVITGGTGNDVIVLGTEANSNDVVKYDIGFGNDTIVNFVAAATGVTGADVLDFTALGGAKGNFGSLTANKSIVVAAETAANNTAVEIAALFDQADAVASNHVYVAYDAATNVGKVYTVADAAGTGTTAAPSATATLVGTIDLADTAWADLTNANFA